MGLFELFLSSSPQGIEEGIVNILRARCSLDVMPSIKFVSYQSKEFVVATCPQGARKPYLVSGETRPYVRVGSSNRKAQNEEVRRLYIEGSEGGFEALSSRDATIADLAEELIAAYVRRRKRRAVSHWAYPGKRRCIVWAAWWNKGKGKFRPTPG
ncbi:MAG: hypothetical protein U9R15_13580 [Chloroflexota bacterium]|nr:hypothetical protein [Chloroflexota bacterium]